MSSCPTNYRYQPILLLALDDYFKDPSQDCLARLFDAVNTMDLSGAPVLSRNEKLIMRSSERKGVFAEKFENSNVQQTWGPGNAVPGAKLQHKSTNSNDSYSSFDEGILFRKKGREESKSRTKELQRDAEGTSSGQGSQAQYSPSDSSFSLGGSAVWVGDESGLDLASKDRGDAESVASLMASSTLVGSSRKRRSTDASSSSSSHLPKDPNHRHVGTSHAHHDNFKRQGMVKDTQIYHTTMAYRELQLPIKMPLSTFPEEVGDVSC